MRGNLRKAFHLFFFICCIIFVLCGIILHQNLNEHYRSRKSKLLRCFGIGCLKLKKYKYELNLEKKTFIPLDKEYDTHAPVSATKFKDKSFEKLEKKEFILDDKYENLITFSIGSMRNPNLSRYEFKQKMSEFPLLVDDYLDEPLDISEHCLGQGTGGCCYQATNYRNIVIKKMKLAPKQRKEDKYTILLK